MSFFDNMLYPIMVAVAWIMVGAHDALVWVGDALGLGFLTSESGLTWSLSIVFLVIVIRILLIPLFVRQIKASRGLQIVQPEIQKLQKKYKGKTDPASRQAQQQEMMAIYREHKTNPLSSCLPILAQSPIFFALFRVLVSLGPLAAGTYARDSIGPLNQDLARSAEESTFLGAQLSATFLTSDDMVVKLVTVLLIAMMSLTQFFTQRQLIMKNMPASALDNPMAKQQKMLMYLLPLIFVVTGVNFPIGVLIYWTTSNLWTMGQQFYVIARMPAPGSEAEKALKARRARKAARRGVVLEDASATEAAEADKPKSGQRAQPKRKDRAKKGAAGPAAGSDSSGRSSGDSSAANGASAGSDEDGAGGEAATAGGEDSSNGSATSKPSPGAARPQQKKKRKSGKRK